MYIQTEMKQKTIEKDQLADLLPRLYSEGKSTDSLDETAIAAQLRPQTVRGHFADMDAWIAAAWCRVPERYIHMMQQVPDISEYTAGERLGNFVYASMDIMREELSFYRETFNKAIYDRYTSSDFELQVKQLFDEVVSNDPAIASSSRLVLFPAVFGFWSREYLHLLKEWLEESATEEQTMALVEKSTTLLNEFLYNGVIDKTVDFGRYLIGNGLVSATTPIELLRRHLRW